MKRGAMHGAGGARQCSCGGTLHLTVEQGGSPWPETLAELPEGQDTFTGYAEHWECRQCGRHDVNQIPQ